METKADTPKRTFVRKSAIAKERLTFGLLICTLISENQGLEKSRSASNLRKISGPANLDFFSRFPPRKKARFIP